MKSVRTIFTVSVVILGLLFCLTGCDKDNGTSSKGDLVGTWKMQKVKIAWAGNSIEATAEASGMTQILVVDADGTYTMTMTDEDGTDVDTGTWSVSGSTLTIDSDDPDSETETGQYKVEGNVLTITMTEKEDMDDDGVDDDVTYTATFIKQ